MKIKTRSILLIAACAVSASHVLSQGPLPRPDGTSRRFDLKKDVIRDPEMRIKQMKSDDDRVRKAMNKTQGKNQGLTKAEMEGIKSLRKIDPADLATYQTFLKGENTGIIKLFPDLDCGNPNIVHAGEKCANFVPLSSYFSFRSGQYADVLNQDIGMVQNQDLLSGGFFSQGIFVPLGNTSLEEATLQHPAVRYLVGLEPSADFASARERAIKLWQGIPAGEYVFAGHVKVKENTTYAFRLIAYKLANSLPPASENSTFVELLFQSLANDKRMDSTYIFRVARLGPLGEATIVWKELSKTQAPKLKFEKGEPLKDFKW